MAGNPGTCPHCGAPVQPDQGFCADCGTALLARGGLAPGPGLTGDSYRPVQEADILGLGPRPETPSTQTGLLLMIIGFALGWIPYVSIVAAIIALVGLVFLWIGRGEFGAAHRRDVHLGIALVVLAFLVELVGALAFVGAVVSAASAPDQTVSGVGASFRADLAGLFVTTVVVAALGTVGYASLPYSLADRTSQGLLWTAPVVAVALSSVAVAILWPELSSAIAAATSGSSINTGPILALDTKATLLGALQIVPNMMFLTAYYRVRNRLVAGRRPTVGPATPTYGRTG